MGEEPVNEWSERNHYVRIYNYVQEEWEEVNVVDLREADWRRWVCSQLEQLKKAET